MDTAAELGTNSVSKHQIQPEYGDEQADAGQDCRTRRCRETKFSGANGEWEEFIFPVQLTTSRISNLSRLILTLAICDDHICKEYDIIRQIHNMYVVCCRSSNSADGRFSVFFSYLCVCYESISSVCTTSRPQNQHHQLGFKYLSLVVIF